MMRSNQDLPPSWVVSHDWSSHRIQCVIQTHPLYVQRNKNHLCLLLHNL